MKNINIFFEKKPLKMICLGFSSGLPILLVFSTLSVWLVKAGISRSTVTLFSWAGFAYAFKYLWSPLVDNYKLPIFKKFGHRSLSQKRMLTINFQHLRQALQFYNQRYT